MGISLGEITMGFGFEMEGLMTGIESAKKALEGFFSNEKDSGGFGKMIDVGATAAAVGLVALGTEAIKSAGEFQEGMTLLRTAGGETEANMQLVSDGIMKISVSTSTMTSALLPAMLSIEASGQHGTQALLTLTAAAEGAKASGESLSQTTKLLDDSMKAFHLTGSDAASTMSLFEEAAILGKDKLSDFGQSMQRILPQAAQAGLGLGETTAAMATLSATGMRTMTSAMSLRMIITQLETPSSTAAKALTSLGLSTSQVSAQMRKQPDGMISTMREISVALAQKFPSDAAKATTEFTKVKAGTETMDQALAKLAKTTTPGYQAALKAIAGSSQNVASLSALTGAGLQNLSNNFTKITGSAKEGKTSVTGFAEASGDFNFKLGQLHAAANVAMITLGNALLPAVTNLTAAFVPLIAGIAPFIVWLTQGSPLAKTLVGVVLSLVGAFIAWKVAMAGMAWADVIGNIMKMLAILPTQIGVLWLDTQAWLTNAAAMVGQAFSALGEMLAPMGALIASIWAETSAWIVETAMMLAANWPILLIIAGIALLIAIVILLVTHWGAVVAFLRNVWGAFATWFGNVMSAIGTFFRGVWTSIATFFEGIWNHIVSFATGVWTNIVRFFTSIWSGISSFFSGIWNAIYSFIAGILGKIISFFETWGGKFIATQAHHLAEVAAFFTAIWNTIVGFLTGIWNRIVTIATTIWGLVVKSIMAVVIPIVGLLMMVWNGFTRGITVLWNLLVTVATTVWHAVSTVIVAVVTTVIGWLKAIWNGFVVGMKALWNLLVGIATTVWNTVSSAVMGVVNTIVTWLTTIWHNEVTNFTNEWNKFAGIATTAWNAVSSAVIGVVTAVIGWVMGQWNTFKANIAAAWNALAGLATAAWNAVTGAFRSAWGGISSALGTILSNITGWFNNLASQAMQWGINVIQQFINGIGSMVGAVGQAASNIMGAVGNFLFGGSPTKEGPGRKLMLWGPSIARGFADGLVNGIPLVQAAMNKLTLPLASAMSGSISLAATSHTPVTSAAGSGYGAAGQQGVTVENHFYMDGTEMTDQIITRMTKKIRAGNPVGRTV